MKISIITVCRNEKKTIEKTMTSVLSQTYKEIQYLVIDGASTDGTKEIINKYKNKIDVFISEKDKGIYDAMNKGLRRASGQYVYFLNANDSFVNDSVVKEVISKVDDEDVVYGNVMMGKRQNRFNGVNRWFLIKNTICHQAIFCKRNLFEKCGFFSLEYKIAADYDWLLNLFFRKEIRSKYLDVAIANFSMDGISSNKENRAKVLREYDAIRKKHFGVFEIAFFKIYCWLIGLLLDIKKVIV